MPATAADFPNTSYENVSEPISSAAGPGKIGFAGTPIESLNIGNLENLNRLAGNLGVLFGQGSSAFDIEDSIKDLKNMYKQTRKAINNRMARIYPELTGMTGEEALNKYYDAFANTISDVSARGRADLGVSPDISSEYNRLNTRVQDIQNQYSLSGRLGGYENLALNPPVVAMDVASIRNTADWVDPTTNQIKGKYKAMYDYRDPQTQQFIYGSRNTADAIGKYYNTSGDVAGLMSYSNVGLS
jgi:hypothetical protein